MSDMDRIDRFLKSTISVVIAAMESVSVTVFVWSALSVSSPFLVLVPLISIFCLSYISARRNMDKIARYFNSKDKSSYAFKLLNLLLSLLMGLVTYLTKRFALLVFIPASCVLLTDLAVVPAIVHSVYTVFNTLADMHRSSHCLRSQAYIAKFHVNINTYLQNIFATDKDDMAVFLCLLYAALCRCHYNMLSVSLSIVALSDKYGGWYQWLPYIRRFLNFPLILIALNNVYRCTDVIVNTFSRKSRGVDKSHVLGLSMIVVASYTHAVSSKLLQVAQHNIVPMLMIDKGANYIRQYGFKSTG